MMPSLAVQFREIKIYLGTYFEKGFSCHHLSIPVNSYKRGGEGSWNFKHPKSRVAKVFEPYELEPFKMQWLTLVSLSIQHCANLKHSTI